MNDHHRPCPGGCGELDDECQCKRGAQVVLVLCADGCSTLTLTPAEWAEMSLELDRPAKVIPGLLQRAIERRD